jgi:hypothetical protein
MTFAGSPELPRSDRQRVTPLLAILNPSSGIFTRPTNGKLTNVSPAADMASIPVPAFLISLIAVAL